MYGSTPPPLGLVGDWLDLSVLICVYLRGRGTAKETCQSPDLNLQGFVSLEKLEFLISMSIFLIILVGYFRDIWLWVCSNLLPHFRQCFFALFQPQNFSSLQRHSINWYSKNKIIFWKKIVSMFSFPLVPALNSKGNPNARVILSAF